MLAFYFQSSIYRAGGHHQLEGGGNYDEVKGIKFIVYVSIIRSQCRCAACLPISLVSAKVAGVNKVSLNGKRN
jgi:hypothetical protein